RNQSYFFEFSTAFVVIQKFRHRVVCHKNIGPPVAVIIRERNAQTFAWLRDAGLLGDFAEMAVPIIVIHQWSDRLEKIRVTIGAIAFLMLAAPEIVEVPLHVA